MTVEQPAPDRLPILDLGRIVAALAVYAFHALYLAPGTDGVPWTSPMAPLASYGYLGVEFFFMLSGFVIALSAQGRSRFEFARTRFARLFPAFVLCMSLTVLTKLGMGEATSPMTVLANLTFEAKALGYQYVDPVYWSLSVEVLFYVYVWLFLVGPRFTERARWFVIAWGLLSLLPLPTKIGTLLNLEWAGYFSVGIVTFLWHSEKRLSDLLLLAAVILVAGAESFSRAQLTGIGLALRPSPLIAAVVVVVLAAALPFLASARLKPGLFRSACFVGGAMSYPVYLLHFGVGMALLRAAYPNLAAVVLLNGALFIACYAVSRIEAPVRQAIRRVPEPRMWRLSHL